MRPPSQAELKAAVDAFNQQFPVGSPVTAYKGALGENPIATTVRLPAEILSGHTPVAWLNNISGCVMLTHIKERKVEEPDTTARILRILDDHQCVAVGATSATATYDSLGLDSLDCIELVMTAEEEFDIEISDDDAEFVKSVADAVKLIEGKLSAKAGA